MKVEIGEIWIEIFRRNCKNGNFIVSVGDSRYLDFPYYIKNFGIKEAIKRRRLYKLRHKADKDVKGTAGYYADKLLW